MRLTRAMVKTFLPPRPPAANKGSFGRVLVVAGSEKMSGAAVLCCRSALKSGAGLVALALPKSRQCVAAAALPEMLTCPLPEADGLLAARAVPVLRQFVAQFRPSVVLVGPGLGAAPFIIPFLKENQLPAVLDADALNVLAQQPHWPQVLGQRFPVICTPHPGEMQRLLQEPIADDEKTRQMYAVQLSQQTGGVSVLKGHHTVITDGKTVYINPTGGPALAKAGSGDTLAGLIAGLWAQLGTAGKFDTQSALRAAACGVYLHGLCGDLAAKKWTDRCVLASEVADQLPAAFKKVLSAR